MSHPEPEELESDDVEYYRADDGRTVAIHLRSTFEDYESFPPYLDTEEEREHLREAYEVRDPDFERRTKAHITPDEYPIQVVVLNRPPGSAVNPHYHEVTDHPTLPTRHQIMYCQRGALEIGVYTKDGDHLGDARVEAGDLLLMAEGHSIEFAEPDTKAFEFKQGPFPETDAADKIDLDVE